MNEIASASEANSGQDAGVNAERQLFDAAIAILGGEAMALDELRAAARAEGHDVGEPNEYGRDALDIALDINGTIEHLGDDRVAHAPAALVGVSFTFPITESDAEQNTLQAHYVDPLTLWIIDEPPQLIDAAGNVLGILEFENDDDDERHEDSVIVGPDGWLATLATGHGALTAVDLTTVRIDPIDDLPPVTDALSNAVQLAFDRVAGAETLTTLTDDAVSVRTTFPSPMFVELVVSNRAAIGDQLPPLDALITESGLEFDGLVVGAAGTDWDAVRAEGAIHRLCIERGFDHDQAQMFVLLVGAASMFAELGDSALGDDTEERVGALTLFGRALEDAAVAEQAWDEWTHRQQVGETLQPFVDKLVELFDEELPGVSWLRARQLALDLATEDAIRLLEAHGESGHAAVLIDLAAFAADRSDPSTAQRLLRAAGVDTDIDLDAEFDPLDETGGLGTEIAEEIAPYSALRPRATAGRNDPCPCGSGRKYKQCHLGRELHTLEDRAGWLYLKMIRFLGFFNPMLPDAVIADMLDGIETWELAQALESSYVPIDIALHEGGITEQFLIAKASLLPDDERQLTEQWIAAPRSVLRVEQSPARELHVIDLATQAACTIVDTVPEQPIPVGSLMCGRLLPVGDSYRTYGGLLPIDESMVESVLAACATRKLEAVAISLSQIFDAAEMVDSLAAEPD